MWRQRQDGETVIFQGVVRRIDRHRDFGFIARDEKDVTDEVPRRFDIFFSPRHVDQGVSVDDVVQYTRIRKSEGFVATDVRLVLEPDSDQDRKISRSEKPLARQNDSGDGDGFGAGRGRSGGGWRGGGGGGGRGDGGGRSSYVKQEYPSGWYAERIYRGRCVSVFSTYGFICPSGRTREDPTENVFFHFNELGYGQSGVPIGQSVRLF
jgi:cold shock CspA family protein